MLLAAACELSSIGGSWKMFASPCAKSHQDGMLLGSRRSAT